MDNKQLELWNELNDNNSVQEAQKYNNEVMKIF